MTESAREYLQRISASMPDRYTAEDCLTHARAVAERLIAEGRSPWIGRLRHITMRGENVFWEPLTPLRFRSSTWNTHYVCCCDGEAWDPIVGAPIALSDYSRTVFGHDIAVTEDETFTQRLLRAPEAQSQPPRH